MGSKSITTFRFVIRGEMSGLNNSTMKDFLNILLQKKIVSDDIIIQRQRF